MDSMLTTTDNPFNPFTQWADWMAFDVAQGYNTCAYLDRVTITSEELSDEDQDQAIVDAMNDIVNHDPLGIYIIVYKS